MDAAPCNAFIILFSKTKTISYFQIVNIMTVLSQKKILSVFFLDILKM